MAKKGGVLVAGTLCYIVLLKLSRGSGIGINIGELFYFIRSLFALLLVAVATLFTGYKLDQLFSEKKLFTDAPLKRVIATTLSAWVIATVSLLIVWLLFFMIINPGIEIDLYETLIGRIAVFNYQFLVALFYISYLYMNRMRQYEQLPNVEKHEQQGSGYTTKLSARSKGETRLLEVENIVFFAIADGVIFAHMNDEKKYMMTVSTLGDLEKQLDPAVFFRINRSEILNLKYIDSYKSYRKDRLIIELKGYDQSLITSNARAPGFRKWVTE